MSIQTHPDYLLIEAERARMFAALAAGLAQSCKVQRMAPVSDITQLINIASVRGDVTMTVATLNECHLSLSAATTAATTLAVLTRCETGLFVGNSLAVACSPVNSVSIVITTR